MVTEGWRGVVCRVGVVGECRRPLSLRSPVGRALNLRWFSLNGLCAPVAESPTPILSNHLASLRTATRALPPRHSLLRLAWSRLLLVSETMGFLPHEQPQRAPPTTLYAFGSNGSGQLGLGHTEDESEPQPVADTYRFRDQQPTWMAAGGNHTVIITADCEIFAAGDNSNGRIPWQNLSAGVSRFTDSLVPRLPTPPSIKLCAATWEASTLVSEDRVMTCGTGNHGELGQGENVRDSPWPQKLPKFPPSGTRVVDIAACMSHTVAILDNGEVYGWGNGRKGQLGEPAAIVWSPRKIEGIPFHAFRVTCGREFTYIAGHPREGTHLVLGSDKFSVKSTAPKEIADYVDVGSGWSSIYVLLRSGKIVAWGRNDHGQLPPRDLPPVEFMTIGSEHVLAKIKDGNVVAWGWGEHGNCGKPTNAAGDVVDTWNEIPVKGEVKMITAGCATSFILAHEEPAQPA